MNLLHSDYGILELPPITEKALLGAKGIVYAKLRIDC